MHLVIKAGNQQKEEILSKGITHSVKISWANNEFIEGDAYFDLLFEEDGPAFASVHHKPVFANAVIATCLMLPSNYIRINAWNGFLNRELVEIAALDPAIKAEAENILNKTGWKFIWTPDEPGMIAARIISMIINEAYFGLGDKISTKQEIDIAMKLGTNYPYGPFEWSEKIGLHRIYQLLRKLAEQNPRYAVAPKLEEELKSIA